jgi:hypothetical protein
MQMLIIIFRLQIFQITTAQSIKIQQAHIRLHGSSCVSSHASSHDFGTIQSPLPKVHACDFAQNAAPNSVSVGVFTASLFRDTLR